MSYKKFTIVPDFIKPGNGIENGNIIVVIEEIRSPKSQHGYGYFQVFQAVHSLPGLPPTFITTANMSARTLCCITIVAIIFDNSAESIFSYQLWTPAGKHYTAP